MFPFYLWLPTDQLHLQTGRLQRLWRPADTSLFTTSLPPTRRGGQQQTGIRERDSRCVGVFFLFFFSSLLLIIIIIRLLVQNLCQRSHNTTTTAGRRPIKAQETGDVSWAISEFFFLSSFHFANSPFRLSLKLFITTPSHSQTLPQALTRKRPLSFTNAPSHSQTQCGDQWGGFFLLDLHYFLYVQ